MTIPSLPLGSTAVFLDEGAANVVYRLPGLQSSSISSSSVDKGLVLRLRKSLPSRVSVRESYEDFHSNICSLFSSQNLVDLSLIRVPKRFIEDCNEELKRNEELKIRREDRSGLYLDPNEQYGLVMSDMCPNEEKDETLIEIKPKWLLQSPSAPKDSLRCRTCALRARNNAKRVSKGMTEIQSFCPLDLCSANQQRQERAVDAILASSLRPSAYSVLLRRRIITDLNSSGLLQRLAGLQRQFDPHGVLASDVHAKNFRIAMTIRDCTLFIKVPSTPNDPLELRLADLDIKSAAEGKGEYWKTTETDLIDGGWYTKTEKFKSQKIDIQCDALTDMQSHQSK